MLTCVSKNRRQHTPTRTDDRETGYRYLCTNQRDVRHDIEIFLRSLFTFGLRLTVPEFASAILGILGAGGVGSLLAQVFERRDWERIGITLTVIIVVTVIVDQISGAVRHRVISGVPVAGAKALV